MLTILGIVAAIIYATGVLFFAVMSLAFDGPKVRITQILVWPVFVLFGSYFRGGP